jgi:hypothetical protein
MPRSVLMCASPERRLDVAPGAPCAPSVAPWGGIACSTRPRASWRAWWRPVGCTQSSTWTETSSQPSSHFGHAATPADASARAALVSGWSRPPSGSKPSGSSPYWQPRARRVPNTYAPRRQQTPVRRGVLLRSASRLSRCSELAAGQPVAPGHTCTDSWCVHVWLRGTHGRLGARAPHGHLSGPVRSRCGRSIRPALTTPWRPIDDPT